MKIGISCTSVGSYKFDDNAVNITGDAIEAYFLQRRFSEMDEVEHACVFGMNHQRGIVEFPKQRLDVAIHLNLDHELQPCFLGYADKNIFFYQNVHPDPIALFGRIENAYDAVMFYSVEILDKYLAWGGKLPCIYMPFATEHELYTYTPYPRYGRTDICYIGSSITRSQQQYENIFKPLIREHRQGWLSFFLGGRYVVPECPPEVATHAVPVTFSQGPQVYKESKVGLVVTNEEDVSNGVITSRCYDYMACGTLMIVEDHQYLRDYFGDLVDYYTKDNIIETLDGVLNRDEDQQNEQSLALHKLLISNMGTYQNQVRAILNFAEECFGL